MNRVFILAVICCCTSAMAGCSKVAPQAAKVIAGAEKEAVAPLARSLKQAKRAAVVPRGGWTGAANQENAQQARAVVKRIDSGADAFTHFQRSRTTSQAAPASDSRFHFPHPLSQIQPIGPPFLVDAANGISACPNNFGGHIFYDSDGEAIGFSAYHIPSGATNFFDRWGMLL